MTRDVITILVTSTIYINDNCQYLRIHLKLTTMDDPRINAFVKVIFYFVFIFILSLCHTNIDSR